MAELDAANARLKAGKHRCSIQLRGRVYTLVATLPERDGPGKRQQRIPLREADLYEAERQAIELARQVSLGVFSWEAWRRPRRPRPSPQTTSVPLPSVSTPASTSKTPSAAPAPGPRSGPPLYGSYRSREASAKPPCCVQSNPCPPAAPHAATRATF